MKQNVYTIIEHGSFVRGRHIDGYKFLPSSVFDKLEEFILENAEKGNELLDLMSVSVKKHIGKVITARSYVGVIALNDGSVIEILPKIVGESNEVETKKILINMLKTVNNSPFKNLQTTNINIDKLPIFEIFISMFLSEIFSIVKKGLKSGYETIDDNIYVCKGKIDFNQQIKHNLIHREKFCVHLDELNNNQPENKLIKTTLKYLFKHTVSSKNKTDIKLLLNIFESINESSNVDLDITRCSKDRNSKYYKTALMWCKVFLKGKSFTSYSGSEVAYALLFPMQTLFESYVAIQVKRQTNASEYTVSTQDSLKHLFDNPKKFSLRPDIVITNKSNNLKFIFDTKWKVLTNSPSSNYGISQSDMYQMYAYHKKYGEKVQSVTLLYPMIENAPNEDIKFSSIDGVVVNVVFVDLTKKDIPLKLK